MIHQPVIHLPLPHLQLRAPNQCVLAHLAASPRRDPGTARGRPLYLQRLGIVVLPQQRDGAGWICTAAAAGLDAPAPVGAFWIGDVEIAAAVEVRDPCYPLSDLAPEEFCAIWMVQVWDRWPGGRRLQAAQALVEFVELGTLTVVTAPAWQPALARRAGFRHAAAMARHCAELAAAGLLAPCFSDPAAGPGDEQRRYRLQLPPATTWEVAA